MRNKRKEHTHVRHNITQVCFAMIHHWRVVSPRGTWRRHKQQLAAGSLANKRDPDPVRALLPRIMLHILIVFLQFTYSRMVLKISGYGLSSFTVRNVRAHSTSKNQLTCFSSVPTTYTLHTTCFNMPIFGGDVFRNFPQRTCNRK